MHEIWVNETDQELWVSHEESGTSTKECIQIEGNMRPVELQRLKVKKSKKNSTKYGDPLRIAGMRRCEDINTPGGSRPRCQVFSGIYRKCAFDTYDRGP